VNIMTGEGKTGTADPATAQAGTSAAMMTPQGGTTMADLEQSLREADDLQDGEARTKDGGKVAEAGAPEGDDAGKGEKADDGANAEDKERAERERLTPEQQAAVDRRIGKEVAKRKSLEEQLEAAQEETEGLRTELESARNTATAAAGVHPLLAAESEKDLNDFDVYLDQVEDWTTTHWDGYEGTDEKKDPSYTAEQVRARHAQLRKERRLLDRARDLYRQREQGKGDVKQVYPDLLDRSTESYREGQRILARIPGLKTAPDGLMLVGDVLAGRQLRMKSKGNKPGAGASERALRLPIDNRGVTGSSKAHEERTPAKGEINVGRLVEAGGGVDALAAELEATS